MKFKAFIVSVFFICSLLSGDIVIPDQTCAAWSDNPQVNTPISIAGNHQLYPRIISDGSGGAIITWEDYRNGNADIYAQRINSSGVVQWTADGVAICTASGTQYNQRITVDGWGGAIITWEDYRDGNADIYAQRINSSGVVQWTANGVDVCPFDDEKRNPQIISAGWGGAIITWEDDRATGPNNINIYAQQINTAGALLWPQGGVAICTQSNHQANPTIASDGSGGAIITWRDLRSLSDYDIYAQWVNLFGVVQWAVDGKAICMASYDQLNPRIISYGSGGAIITWRDFRSGTTPGDIYAQRIDKSGLVQWTESGIDICKDAHYQSEPTIISDGSGGALIVWTDGRSGTNNDIYAQRINSSGVVQWTANGKAVCTEVHNQLTPTITSDGSGGAIITWWDGRNQDDIYAQRINSSGVVQWTADGVAVCTASGPQYNPTITSDGSAGAIITWHDGRGASWDIYAQRIYGSGTFDEDFPWVIFYPAILKKR